jgi:lipopolysaccharide biosynthesis regulator YciM
LQIEPSATLARYELGRIERSQGHIEAAVREFEKVVQADPNWLRPHIELAALYYRLNRPEDGRKERAIVEKLSSQEGHDSDRLSPGAGNIRP